MWWGVFESILVGLISWRCIQFVMVGRVSKVSSWLRVGLWEESKSLELEFAGRQLTVEVCNKVLQGIWDLDRREEERRRWVDALRRSICWVFLACNIACNNRAVVSREEVMDSPEDDICLSVATSAFPPSFHDAPVIPEEPEVLARLTSHEDSMDEELEANCFGPPNVSSFSVPTLEEPPSSLTACDNNSDANPRAGIWESPTVLDDTWTRDCGESFLELRVLSYHWRSSLVSRGGWCNAKGFVVRVPSMVCRLVR
jgi:hypothetical protein